jgi:hypothetical protein
LTNRPRPTANDLQEVTTRHRTVRDLTLGLAAEHPADIWQFLLTAFADIPAIAAHHDGEADPLCYLRDELRAQGYDTTGWGSR